MRDRVLVDHRDRELLAVEVDQAEQVLAQVAQVAQVAGRRAPQVEVLLEGAVQWEAEEGRHSADRAGVAGISKNSNRLSSPQLTFLQTLRYPKAK